MLTARGWWMITAAGLLTFSGVIGLGWISATVPLLGMAMLVWIGFEWVRFAGRYRASIDQFTLKRSIIQGGRAVPAIWSGSSFQVRIVMQSSARVRLPYLVVEDRLPTDYTLLDGVSRTGAALDDNDQIRWQYTLKAEVPGIVRFEGVQVRFADESGLFYRRRFLREPVEYLVLPPLTDNEGKHRGTKRFNTLPPPGVHRLRRAGSGSELLDLRDYRPGDPPKMIAWKASARRDKLITKEFENDVPLRCMIFVDASNRVRIGENGATPLVRLVDIAAGVAQAATADRDLVGLTIFDEESTTALSPARSRTHIVQMLRSLSLAAGRLPDPKAYDADLIARYAFPVAQELYPDLLDTDVNSKPVGMYWLPISDTRWLWLLMILLAMPMLVTRKVVLEFLAQIASTFAPEGSSWKVLIGLILLPTVAAGLLWFFHGVRGFFAPRSTRVGRRKQLGLLFAARDGTGAAAVERAIHDDNYLLTRATQFLTEHRVRLPIVMNDRQGLDRFRDPAKIVQLANALTRSIAIARDNELFVILADLVEMDAHMEPLLRAIKVARARHHQVMVILPWPRDIPLPEKEKEPHPGKSIKIGAVVRQVLIGRYHKSFAALRTTLVSAGATVVRAEEEESVQLVLDRLDRLRGVRIRR